MVKESSLHEIRNADIAFLLSGGRDRNVTQSKRTIVAHSNVYRYKLICSIVFLKCIVPNDVLYDSGSHGVRENMKVMTFGPSV